MVALRLGALNVKPEDPQKVALRASFRNDYIHFEGQNVMAFCPFIDMMRLQNHDLENKYVFTCDRNGLGVTLNGAHE